jgi:hypothetical protein
MNIRIAWTALAVATALATSPAAAQQSDSVEVYNHRLNLAELEKAMQATRNLNAAMQADPDMARRINVEASGPQKPETLDQISARLGKDPAVRKALSAAGLTPRAYTLTFLALATTGTQQASANAGAQPATPAIAANILLYQQNKAKFEQWGTELRAMQPNPDRAKP